MSQISILGSGTVGDVLSKAFQAIGYQVVRGTRDPSKARGRGEDVKTFEEASKASEIVLLAVKGTAAELVVKSCAPFLENKIVIDSCNPIADAAPVNGVLSFFTGPNESLMERLQKCAPKAHFVKAFSCVGNAHMFKPSFPEKPTMFICGNNAESKGKVQDLLKTFGWDVADMGLMESARAIEPLCMLWCIPGLKDNQWNHAFRLMRG
jgi:predicted dinucleotide-binding enzyme